MELFQNTLSYLANDHGIAGQYAGWIITAFAVALTLSAIIQQAFPRRPVADDLFEHPSTGGDWPAASGLNTWGASIEAGCDGHLAGSSTLCSEPVDNS